ncbi:hypothetical protein [Solitalea lacus]|uniref:hypothetical protein n=1 Tax=Solitalea lacus TaxID=2911172 RepID=UPI001ED9D864|nr:hypothetical protein [Solitalea lacus]UKJ06572.1 hypothetical protein L2B55_13665 [Solitalea lacus]
METFVGKETLIMFSPEILSQLKQEGYQSIREEQLIDLELDSFDRYDKEVAFLLTPSFEEYRKPICGKHHYWYGNSTNSYSIDSAELNIMAEGISHVVYYIGNKTPNRNEKDE